MLTARYAWQVENHPYWRNDSLSNYLAAANVHMTAYSPLGTPDFLDSNKSKAPRVLEDETVKAIAKEVGKTPGQVGACQNISGVLRPKL